jgi:hypothetical protein
VALTLLPVLPQMREKYVGRFARDTFTVTTASTANPEPKVEQSGFPELEEALSAE